MNYSDFDNITLEQLRDYIENGNIDTIPPHIASLLSLMEFVRSLMIDQHKSYDYIIRLLQLPPYSLSRYKADKIYTETLNFHYAQKDVTEAAICNLYADKFDKLAQLCIVDNKFEEANRCFDKAAFYRLQAIKKKDIPQEIFEKKTVLYSIDPKLLGGRKANRNDLAKFIDDLPGVSEYDKNRLHRDGMTTDDSSIFFDVTDAEIEINEK